ncbi:4f9314d7-2466-4650-8238-cb699295253b [Sclerotinia trifoliorum]|uniref:4f9314d7-2466-4650-8238-cb699295253b n=1 Tax=Sclerotinia trifoliorum TaxID=28548 RepID=A0A8H2W355_9HELO|nr:4f9314d7-2466-4650-8238-cb699295253b [Sclerotinia trifoliorum]
MNSIDVTTGMNKNPEDRRPSTHIAHYNAPSHNPTAAPHKERRPSTHTAHYNTPLADSNPYPLHDTNPNPHLEMYPDSQPPSYNPNPDPNPTTYGKSHPQNQTPPQFQNHPEPQSQSQWQNQTQNRPGNKYENQHPTPLTTLQKEPRLVHCPRCGVMEYTQVEWVSGGTTDISALLCCFCFCLPCVPYLMTSFKDVHHKCGNCGLVLAIWKRSGRTEVTAAASATAASGGVGGVGGVGGAAQN